MLHESAKPETWGEKKNITHLAVQPQVEGPQRSGSCPRPAQERLLEMPPQSSHPRKNPRRGPRQLHGRATRLLGEAGREAICPASRSTGEVFWTLWRLGSVSDDAASRTRGSPCRRCPGRCGHSAGFRSFVCSSGSENIGSRRLARRSRWPGPRSCSRMNCSYKYSCCR